MNRKSVIPLVIVALGLIGAVAMIKLRPEPPRKTPPAIAPLVQVQEVTAVEHTYTVEATGTVYPRTVSSLVAEVAGRVISVNENFDAGGFFERDQILLTIDDRDYLAAAAAAEADVATAHLAFAREEEEARVALEEWERFGREGEPTSLVLREPQLVQSAAQLASAEARLERARRDLDRTKIRAPFAGRVRTQLRDVGDYVAPGTPTASVYAVDYAEVRLPLPDEELAFLDLPLGLRTDRDQQTRGPAVTLSGEFAGAKHTWTGYVHRTEGEIDARTRMLNVIVRVADPYGAGASADGTPLSVGMFVTATIEGSEVAGAIIVPRSALIGEDRIAVVGSDDRLELRTVNVLRTSNDQAILGAGLSPGERVAVSRLEVVVDGMRVRTAPAGADR
jgi:RND family efflux transporter MFP subunit